MKKNDNEAPYTVMQHIGGLVKYDVPKSAMKALMAERGIAFSALYSDTEKDAIRLLYADVLKWFVLGPSKKNNTTDTDNGWTHAGGGYELTSEDKSDMKAKANAIYAELEPESEIKRKVTFRIKSYGICRASRDAGSEF